MELTGTGTGEGATIPDSTVIPECPVPDGALPDGTVSCHGTATTQPVTDRPATDIEAQVTRLGQELGRHARLLHLMKLRLGEVMPPGLDWAAFGLLSQLVRCGPRRQADLAEISLLDPSTVSRHAAQLVRAQLAERRADPEDGRAVQLVATEQGRAVWENGARKRNEAFLAALSGWHAEDLESLTDLLSRFNDDLEAFRQDGSRAGPPVPSAGQT
ncbi:MAG TPA: MarR family winged helix-turn-helix transcriptional regulator [Kineosporiaceae bacterium]|nr:MarR family winged helix-turn-helix transcriptional regulator [Kineosporiaceae bacterium]